MGKFVQLVVDGLSTGSVYGAIALAIVLVHQATGDSRLVEERLAREQQASRRGDRVHQR